MVFHSGIFIIYTVIIGRWKSGCDSIMILIGGFMPHFQFLVNIYKNDVLVKTMGLMGRPIVSALLSIQKYRSFVPNCCQFSQDSGHAKYSGPTKYLDT